MTPLVILVDAYNVLHTPGVLPLGLAGLDVMGLARLIGAGRYARREIVLVCDGRGSDSRHADLRIVYAGPSHDADGWIEDRLARDSAPRRMLVVSSDRRVLRAADRAGASVLTSATFLAQLALDVDRKKPKPRPRFATDLPLDALSVAYWAGQFGLSREEMARLDDESHAITPTREPRESGKEPAAINVKKPAKSTASDTAKNDGSRQATPVLGEGLAPPAFDAAALASDPVIRSALEHWSGRLSLDDLDMNRWIDQPPADEPPTDVPPPGMPRPTLPPHAPPKRTKRRGA